ncbi:MAG: hypothetical protein MJ252_06880 [archaeon]|nr:hypothetical protein [archaeon]
MENDFSKKMEEDIKIHLNKKNQIKEMLENLTKKTEKNVSLKLSFLDNLSENKLPITNQPNEIESLIIDEHFFGNINISENINTFIEEYKRITGVKIERVSNEQIKFDLNEIFKTYSNKEDNYIILTFKNSEYSLFEISPSEINSANNIESYIKNLNTNRDLNQFLCDLINIEYFSYYNI